MTTEQNPKKDPRLMDFSIISQDFLSIDDMLEIAYNEGRKDLIKDIRKSIEKNLQTAAGFSSLFREKIKDLSISVSNMFLRLIETNEFECLVLLEDSDYYNKEKRWGAYSIAKEVNNSINELEIKFTLMPTSDELKSENITSEGFYFKYEPKSQSV